MLQYLTQAMTVNNPFARNVTFMQCDSKQRQTLQEHPQNEKMLKRPILRVKSGVDNVPMPLS